MKKYIFIIVPILIIMLTVTGCGEKKDDTGGMHATQITKTSENKLLATVDGENIYQRQVDDVVAALKQQTAGQINKSAVLEQIITMKLLILKAKRENINVSDGEAEIMLGTVLLQQGQNMTQYKESITPDRYASVIEQLKNQLLVRKVVIAFKNISVSDEDAKRFYDANPKLFVKNNKTFSFEDTKDQIIKYLEDQKIQNNTQILGKELREDAKIAYY